MTKIIRPTVNHLESVAKLFDAYRVFYRKDSDLAGAEKFISDRLSNADSVIFLAMEEGAAPKYQGFVQLYPLFSSTRMAKLWLLNDLFVDPEFRGRSIGKALIESAKELALQTDAAGLLLETEKSNIIGNNLYPATGFDLVDESNFYFWASNK